MTSETASPAKMILESSPPNITTVLVTGSRDWKDRKTVDHYLGLIEALHPSPFMLIEGGATGADREARTSALRKNWRVKTVEADWTRGRAAGPLRNQEMIDTYRPNIALCLRKNMSGGTTDCMKRLHTFQKKNPHVLQAIYVIDTVGK